MQCVPGLQAGPVADVEELSHVVQQSRVEDCHTAEALHERLSHVEERSHMTRKLQRATDKGWLMKLSLRNLTLI